MGDEVLRRGRLRDSGLAGDDDQGRTGRLLAGLHRHAPLLFLLPRRGRELGEDARRAQVVDAGVQEAGAQRQRRHFLRPQPPPVLRLAQPGERAVHLRGVGAGGRSGGTGGLHWARAIITIIKTITYGV